MRRLRASIVAAAALVSALALGAGVAAPSARAATPTTIEIAGNQTDGTISPEVMGSAYLPPFGAMGSFDSDTDSFWPSFVNDLQTKVYVGSLRWPGGITSQYYDWTRAIGPQAQRTDNPFGPSTGPSPSTVGPDEFGQLLDSTGAAGISTVNFATGDAQEAAEFVQYMTGANGSSQTADLRAQNGHPAPYNVPVWEVGNEEYTTASSWRSGTVVSISGPGDSPSAACTSGTIDAATCQYIYGGSDSFSAQPVVGYANRTTAASKSTGGADQTFYVAYPPIQPASQTIYVNGVAWNEVNSLTGVGAADDYTVDDATGAVTFGDGTDGAVPASGLPVTATYVSGPHSGFLDFYAAMKAANPNIQVCSTDTADAFIQAMGSSLPYDCLQVHPYVGGNNASVDIPTFERTVMADPDAELANVQGWESEMQADAGHSIPVVLTEYGSLISATPNPTVAPYYSDSLDEALVNASQLADWIKGGIQVADRQLLTAELPAQNAVTNGLPNAAPFAVTGAIVTPGPDTIVEPTGQYFELFKPLAGGTLLASTTQDNPVLTTTGPATGALSVTAATGLDGSTDVVVINRDPDNPVASTLSITGVASAGTATLTTLNGPAALSNNTASDPDAVTTTTSTAPVSSGGLALTFPAHSITLVTVPSAPTASFTSAQTAGSLAVQFSDASAAVKPATVTAWSWNFGDGATSTAQSPSHTYGAAGNYTVSLTVTDSNGNQGSFSTNVAVAALPVAAPAVSSTPAPAAPVTSPSANTAKSAKPSPPTTTAKIKKQLTKALTPSRKQLSIVKLLSAGSFKTSFVPLERGKLVVDWYAKASGGKHRILVASDRATFSNEHRLTVKVKLTSRGKKLLHAVKRVVVTGEDTFTPKGKRSIRASQRFRLIAGHKR